MPLAFVYRDDEEAVGVEDQLMVGGSMIIAPVYGQNAKGRYVYLPEDMKLYRMVGLRFRKRRAENWQWRRLFSSR